VTVLGQSIIIINDAPLAFELFEKRSAKYSSRPKQLFSSELYVLKLLAMALAVVSRRQAVVNLGTSQGGLGEHNRHVPIQ
jgi:hypothetical protein